MIVGVILLIVMIVNNFYYGVIIEIAEKTAVPYILVEITNRKWACVEKASFAFGIINIIASVLAILAALTSLVTQVPYINFVLVSLVPKTIKNETLLEGFEHEKEITTSKVQDLNDGAEMLVFYILRMFTACVVIAAAHILLMFSALLVAGVWQKRAGFIKAFFYYGVFTVPIALLLNVLNIADCIVTGNINFILWIQVGIFFAYMFFIIQLVVVRKTFQKLEDPENNFAHTRLQESAYPRI